MKSGEMGKVYDDWERLVEAVLRREKLRRLCYNHSRTPSQSSSDSSSQVDDDCRPSSSLLLHPSMAMAKLQEELIYTLTQNMQGVDHGYMLLPSCDKEPVVLVKHDSVHNVCQGERSCKPSVEFVQDLLHPDMIPLITSIANTMFSSHRDQEFCQAFVEYARGAFSVYMSLLNVEELSTEDVILMEWKCFNFRIKKWRLAIKNFVGLYLAKAKQLFDQVLGEYGYVSSSCLIEASKAPLMCFLSFGRAVAVAPHKQERLFCLLDMYKDLGTLIPDIEAIFPEDTRFYIGVEFYDLLTMLGNSAKVILVELGEHISSSSWSLEPNGGIHSLTIYVMNYILRFTDYDYTLDLVLKETNGVDLNEGSNADIELNIPSPPSPPSPLAAYMQSITSVLEVSIENKSNLFKDSSLKHIFMMNNIHYMVEMIKDFKMKKYFGNEWMKSYLRKLHFHAISYQRCTWGSILPLLRRDGKADRPTLEARYGDFILAFENVYENQTGWCVPSLSIRQELKITASVTVVRAYRNFFSKNTQTIGDVHIKYTDHDLEMYILDFLEGSSTSLNCRCRQRREDRFQRFIKYFGL